MASFGFLGAVGGLGQGLSAVGEDMRKNDNADANLVREQKLAAWRLQTAQAYKIEDEQRAQAPLTRLSAAAQAKAQEQVPVTAAPVTSLPADTTLQTGGLQGNYDDLVKQAQTLPEADRAPYLAQLQQQRDRANASAQQAVAGQTRARTTDEALDAAMADAKLKDPKAYLAGRGLMGDKTVTVADGATVIDPKTGKVIFDGSGSKSARLSEQENRRDQRAQDAESARDTRQQRYLEAQERLAGIRSGTGSNNMSKEERLRYTSLFNESGRNLIQSQKALATLQKDMLTSMAKPGEPKYQDLQDAKDAVKDARKQRDIYATLLAGGTPGATSDGTPTADDPSAGLPPAVAVPDAPKASDNRKAAPLPKLPSGAKQIGTSGGKPVWETPDGRRFVEN